MRENKSDTRNLNVFVYEQQENNTFGKQLRAIRASRNMSQESFGEILGITKQMVSAYEIGLRKPRIDRIITMADRLCLPVRLVFGEEVSVIQSDGAYRTEILSKEAYDVACAYMRAAEHYQNLVRYALGLPLVQEASDKTNDAAETHPH